MMSIGRVGGALTDFPTLAVKRADGVRSEIAVDVDVVFGLESLHRIANRVVIDLILFVARDVEALAQRGHARIFHARTENLAIRHVHARELGLFRGLGFRWRRSLAQLGELGSQRLELGLLRIVGVENFARIAAVAEFGQYVGRFRRVQLVQDVRAHARVVDAPDLRVPRERQGRGGHLEFGFGKCFGGRRRLEVGCRIVGRVQTNRVGLTQVGDRRLGAVVASVVADPDRRVVVRAVIGLDAGPVGLSVDESLKLAARDQFAQLFADGIRGRSVGRGLGRLGGSRRGVLLRLFLCCGSRGHLLGWGIDVFGRQRRRERRIRHRHRRRGRVVALLRDAGMAGQGQDQDQRRGGQQTVKS